jgi:hypothetical protein
MSPVGPEPNTRDERGDVGFLMTALAKTAANDDR